MDIVNIININFAIIDKGLGGGTTVIPFLWIKCRFFLKGPFLKGLTLNNGLSVTVENVE